MKQSGRGAHLLKVAAAAVQDVAETVLRRRSPVFEVGQE